MRTCALRRIKHKATLGERLKRPEMTWEMLQQVRAAGSRDVLRWSLRLHFEVEAAGSSKVLHWPLRLLCRCAGHALRAGEL